MATATKALIPMELKNVRPVGGGYTFDELYRFAQMCHASGMFTDVHDAAQAMIKIVKGQELGLPPTSAMTGFDLIQKRLFIKPVIIAALINSCGYGSYRVLEQTPERCVIRFRRRHPGVGWQDCPDVTYTIAEAEAHGLTKKGGHWTASPANMLYQRAMGRGGAMYFPELLAGLTPPQDDTPISDDQHAANIEMLCGPVIDGTAPATTRDAKAVAPHNAVTGELLPPATDEENDSRQQTMGFSQAESDALDAKLAQEEAGGQPSNAGVEGSN